RPFADFGLRKRKENCCSNAGRAISPDPSVVLFDNGFGDGQSQSRTKVSAWFCLPERIEYLVQVVWVDSPACILDNEPHFSVTTFATHDNVSAFRREFDGIVQ